MKGHTVQYYDISQFHDELYVISRIVSYRVTGNCMILYVVYRIV
jgi:hypothetical protein